MLTKLNSSSTNNQQVTHYHRSSLTMVKNEILAAFMAKKSKEHPYCAVLQTRSGYHCKWLLLKASSTRGIIRRKKGFFVLPTSSLTHRSLQELIVSGDALPLSPVYHLIAVILPLAGNSLQKGTFSFPCETFMAPRNKYFLPIS